MKSLKSIFAVAIFLSVMGCAAHKAPPKAFEPPTPEAMEKAFKLASTPGPEHELLGKLAGTWRAEVKWWMEPGKPPQVSKGKSVNVPVFGGKFIKEEFSGTMMGKPFNGIGYLGYDTVSKEYSNIWIDSMSTAIMTGTGSYDAQTKTWTYNSSMSCPLRDGKMQVKSQTRVIDNKKHIFEMFDTGPDGKEVKTLEITYTRK